MSEIFIEVVIATAEKQSLRELAVAQGSTVADVVRISGILQAFPHLGRDDLTVGIWGREVEENYPVSDGDRVELYRKLELDPREARRQLALVGKTMNNADSA